MRNQQMNWWWMLPLLLIVTALAAAQINTDIFWLDEEFSIFMSGGAQFGPLAPLTIIVRVGDHAWPPLHNLSLVAWSWGFGWSEFATRVFSLYLGVLSVAMVYRLGTDIGGRAVGPIAAVLCASSAFFLHYTHEGRGYTLYVFLTLVAAWGYWRLLTGPSGNRSRGTRLIFMLSMVGLLYTHYIAATTPAALGLYHLLFVRRGRRWHQIFRQFMWALVIFTPWIFIAVLAVLAESGVDRGLDTWTVITSSVYGYGNAIWFVTLGLMIYGSLRQWDRKTQLLWFWLGTAFLMALVFNFFTHFLFHIRHIIVIFPPIILLTAIGLTEVMRTQRLIGGALLAVWIGAGVWGYVEPDFLMNLPGQEQSLPREPMLEAFDVLDTCAQPDDAAVLYISARSDEGLNNRVLRYYLHDQDFRFAQLGLMGDLSTDENPVVAHAYPQRVENLVADAGQVWYLQLNTLPEVPAIDTFTRALSASHPTCYEVDTSALTARVYTANEPLTCTDRLVLCEG